VASCSTETLVGLCEAGVNVVLWHRDRLVGLLGRCDWRFVAQRQACRTVRQV
jgi:hypothetical protein